LPEKLIFGELGCATAAGAAPSKGMIREGLPWRSLKKAIKNPPPRLGLDLVPSALEKEFKCLEQEGASLVATSEKKKDRPFSGIVEGAKLL